MLGCLGSRTVADYSSKNFASEADSPVWYWFLRGIFYCLVHEQLLTIQLLISRGERNITAVWEQLPGLYVV